MERDEEILEYSLREILDLVWVTTNHILHGPTRYRFVFNGIITMCFLPLGGY